MTEGRINSKLEPRVPLIIQAEDGVAYTVSALVDTGFTHEIAMPEPEIIRFGLRYLRRMKVRVADGKMIRIKAYIGSLLWFNAEREVLVLCLGEDVLMGMELLKDYKLVISKSRVLIQEEDL